MRARVIACLLLNCFLLLSLQSQELVESEFVRRVQLKGQLIVSPQRLSKDLILITSDDRRLSLVTIQAKFLWTVQMPKRVILQPQLSREGSILVSMIDNSFALVSLQGAIIRTWQARTKAYKHVFISPEGRLLTVDVDNNAVFCHPNGMPIFNLGHKDVDWSNAQIHEGGLSFVKEQTIHSVFFWSGRWLSVPDSLAQTDQDQLGKKLQDNYNKPSDESFESKTGQLEVSIDSNSDYYEARVYSAKLDVLVRAKTKFGYSLLDQNAPEIFVWSDGLWQLYIVSESINGLQENSSASFYSQLSWFKSVDRSYFDQLKVIRRILSQNPATQSQELYKLIQNALDDASILGRLYLYEDLLFDEIHQIYTKQSTQPLLLVLIDALSLIPSSRNLSTYFDFFEKENDPSIELAWLDFFSLVNPVEYQKMLSIVLKKIDKWHNSSWSNATKSTLLSKAKILLNQDRQMTLGFQ